MSLIGKQPVEVTSGVQVEILDTAVTVKGTHGNISIDIPRGISVAMSDGTMLVTRKNNNSDTKALHGLVQRLIRNAVNGVTTPWEKKLEVIGTGFKVKLQGRNLVFDVGYSHQVEFKSEEGIQYGVQANVVTVSGADRQKVGQIANKIKVIRKPDPYKGKGIRYEGEVIKLKPGKKAKTA